VRVSPETPAERGGIRLGDRILAVDHRPLADQDEMVQQLINAPDRVNITIERSGKLVEMVLTAESAGTN